MATGGSRLSPLQERLVVALADVTPKWTLTGGAALVGFRTRHRTTRDLDLRWAALTDLDEVSVAIRERVAAVGLDCAVLQTGPTFERLRVSDGMEVVLIDLMIDAVPVVESAEAERLGGTIVLVDTAHEILVNKLCALLGRVELRDLVDVRQLLKSGGDLSRALSDAPEKDGGFSPLTLAWTLRGMAAQNLALSAGWDREDAVAIDEFRRQLVDRLVAESAPDG